MVFSWRFIFLFFLFCLFILQQTLFASLIFLKASFNLVLVALLLWLFFENKKKNFGVIAVLLLGVLFDIFSPGIFGAFTISFLLSALMAKWLSSFFRKTDFVGFATVFVGFFIFYFASYAVLNFALGLVFKAPDIKFFLDFEAIAFNLVLNFILAAPFYLILRKKYGLVS